MTLTIEISPETEDRLKTEAAAHGVSPDDYAALLLADNLEEKSRQKRNQRGIEILRRMHAESTALSDEEAARETAAWEDAMRGLDELRGPRKLFPQLARTETENGSR